jgi:hypothetical protein
MPLSLGRVSHRWDCEGPSPDDMKQEMGWRFFRRPFLSALRACLQASGATRTAHMAQASLLPVSFDDPEKAKVGRKPMSVSFRDGRGSCSMKLNRLSAVRKE